MKKKELLTAITLCSCLFGGSWLTAAAQDSTTNGGKKWTLEDCISYALEHNIQLQKSKIKKEQSAVDLKQQKANLFPSLSFSTNQNMSWRPWSQSFTNLNGGTMTTTSSDVNYNGSYGLNANWTVWNGGRNQKNIEKSKVNNDIADYDVAQTANSIQEQIAQYYIQILYQSEAVKVNRQILEASKMQRDRAKTMVEVGSLAKVDLAQLEAQVSQDEYNVVNAQTQLDNYKLDLKQILELVGETDFDVETAAINDENILAALPTKESVYTQAYSQRPEIQSGKLNLQASELSIDIAKRGYYPTISMSAGIGSSNSSGMNKAFGTQLKTNLSNSIGVTVSVPIFDNRQNKTAVETAKLNLLTSQADMQDTEKKLYSQIETYWLNARNAQQQYISARQNTESMQESYDLVSEQFKLGLKNIVELTTGKNNLMQAEQTLLQSKYTALLNQAMLRFYETGKVKL